MSEFYKKSTQQGEQFESDVDDTMEKISLDYVTDKRSTLIKSDKVNAAVSFESSDPQKNDSIQAMRHHARGQISKLQEQADLLVNQAREIEKRVELAEKIAAARFHFMPVLLKNYYLYEEKTGKKTMTLTLIAPEEWKGKCPYGKLLAKVRQLGDSTWEIMD